MGLLRLAVLGSPEVFHDGSRLTFALRKAQALLLYLAVEGGMHPRSKLAALLWPDSEPSDARKGLRNALALLRGLLADADASPAVHSHLLSEHELLGLNLQAPLALGETSAALQVCATCRARLAEALQIAPSADTVALAEYIRATAARSPGSSPSATAERRPPSELVAPLVGRAAAFSQLVGSLQQGQPQAVLGGGEAGIGKTGLCGGCAALAGAQRARGRGVGGGGGGGGGGVS